MVKVISHIILSALFLFSATGVTINMHFCQEKLYDLAINAPAHDCCESDQDVNACHHHHDMPKSHHCDDESIKIESSHDYLVSGFSYDFEALHSFDLFFTTRLLIEKPMTDQLTVVGVINYKKPPPQKVVLSQIQSYLI